MITVSKETADKMKEHVLELGFGWGVLYRDDEIARNQKADDIVNNVLKLFCEELLKNKAGQDD